jgi:quercetin dioxygenase-like cupin family protein
MSAIAMPTSPTLPPPRAVRDLAEEAEVLLRIARATRAGRASATLNGEAPLVQHLHALVAGQRIVEQETGAASTLQVLRGVVHLTTCEREDLLSAGEWTAVPHCRHTLEALEDAVFVHTSADGTARRLHR